MRGDGLLGHQLRLGRALRQLSQAHSEPTARPCSTSKSSADACGRLTLTTRDRLATGDRWPPGMGGHAARTHLPRRPRPVITTVMGAAPGRPCVGLAHCGRRAWHIRGEHCPSSAGSLAGPFLVPVPDGCCAPNRRTRQRVIGRRHLSAGQIGPHG
jgi:hypothetical protein